MRERPSDQRVEDKRDMELNVRETIREDGRGRKMRGRPSERVGEGGRREGD